MRLIGDEGAERTIVDGNRKSAQLLHVSHDDAVVEGITFDNKSFNQRVARLEKGTIRNCVLSGGNWNETGGIYMDNGMLENTIIRNSNSNDAGYGEGYSGFTLPAARCADASSPTARQTVRLLARSRAVR